MLNSRLREPSPWFGALVALALGAIAASGVLVWVRTHVTSMRYELGRRVSHEHELSLEVERLRVEAAALAAPERIEPRALELGLIYPAPEQVISLADNRLAALHDVAAGGPR
ncbi:MAG: cell division protein FtsL [Myxococcota bacterium]